MGALTNHLKLHIPLKTILFVGLACFLVAVFNPRNLAGGFVCGATTFCLSAIGLERLARRIMHRGHVAEGVRSGLFWLFFKFVAPASTIFYGLSRGFSPTALVSGIVSALAIFSAVLWFEQK
jgi:hypothetical protein